MAIVRKLENYSDDHGNRILYEGLMEKDITVHFRGSNNTLILHKKASLHALNAQFDCDNGTVEIGGNTGVIPLKAFIRIGQDSTVKIGNDVILCSQTEICTDDAHPSLTAVQESGLTQQGPSA